MFWPWEIHHPRLGGNNWLRGGQTPWQWRWLDWAAGQQTTTQHCEVCFGTRHNLQKADSGSQRQLVMLCVEKITAAVGKVQLWAAWLWGDGGGVAGASATCSMYFPDWNCPLGELHMPHAWGSVWVGTQCSGPSKHCNLEHRLWMCRDMQ